MDRTYINTVRLLCARRLPAIQWRLKNLESFRRRRPLEWARQVEALESALRE
jgi:hypothetical protein